MIIHLKQLEYFLTICNVIFCENECNFLWKWKFKKTYRTQNSLMCYIDFMHKSSNAISEWLNVLGQDKQEKS